METKSQDSIQDDLKDLLKRCPAGTYEAALAFRQDKDVGQIETIVMGVIDRHLEPEQREILANSDDTLRMYEDLGMDSLTMLEVVGGIMLTYFVLGELPGSLGLVGGCLIVVAVLSNGIGNGLTQHNKQKHEQTGGPNGLAKG